MENEVVVREELQKEGSTALEAALAFQITTNEDYLEADRRTVALNAYKKKVKAHFEDGPNGERDEGPVPKAYAAWKAVVALRDKLLDPADLAVRAYKQKILKWDDQQEEATRKKEAEEAGDHASAQEIISAPVEVPTVVLPKSTPKRTSVVRSIPDRAKIEQAVKANGMKTKIAGVSVYQVVQFEITNSEAVPKEYRKAA